MKYLFIVTEINSANGICTEAVMKALAEQADNEIFCISNKEYKTPGYKVECGIRYYSVKPRLIYRMSSYLSACHQKGKKAALVALVMKLISKAKLAVTIPIWPWISPLYTYRIYKLAKKLCMENEIQCIVPVYTQIDTLIAASILKKKNSRISYVPYFLDSLSGGIGLRVLSAEKTIKKGLKWEERLLCSADEIIVMESSRQHHQKFSTDKPYYSRINYFDIPLFCSRNDEEYQDTEYILKPGAVNIVYVGTLPAGIRSPEYIINVFRKLKGDKWQMWFVGCDDCSVLNKAAQSDDRIHIVGRCSHKKALMYEAGADILLNIGNTNSNMTPSKIFEYMSFAKPIISTCAIKGDSAERYLKKYPAALLLDETSADFAAEAEKTEKFIDKAKYIKFDYDELKKIYYHNTPQAVVDLLGKLNDEKNNESCSD